MVLRKLLELLNRGDRIRLAVLIALLAALALLEMAGVASIMPFMAIVASPQSIHSNRWLSAFYETFGFGSDESFLVISGALVLGILCLNNIGKSVNTWLTLRFQNGLIFRFASRLLTQYMARPYSYFLGRNTADLTSHIFDGAGRVVAGILSPLMDIAANGLICAAIMVLLIIVDPRIAIAIALVLGGSYAVIYVLARKKLGRIGDQQLQSSMMKYRYANEALGGIKELKILGREKTYLDRFALHARRHAINNVTAGVIAQLPRYALEIIAFGGILLVVLYLLTEGREVVGLIPYLALYAYAGYRLLPALQALFSAITSLRANAAYLGAVYAELKAVSGSELPRIPGPDVGPKMAISESLKLERISFHYENATRPALDDLTLEIKANTSIGFVGPTGCGKTTTVDIILGLLVPSSGRLIVDGDEITGANRRNWQATLGYVPQAIYISDDTITRNIAFGVPDEEIDMVAVRRAAHVANLATFIEEQLPRGYDTDIGERGVRMSGGQRQRIGIARALYRDPAVLVMDEATSALDGITEEIVMDAVHNLSGKKTVILIAHRLATVKECDVIYQLDQGRVVASGTYEELIRDSAWFRAAGRMGRGEGASTSTDAAG